MNILSFAESILDHRAVEDTFRFEKTVVFKTALTMLKNYHPGPDIKEGPSIKTKRKMGGWSDEHLSAMLNMDTV